MSTKAALKIKQNGEWVSVPMLSENLKPEGVYELIETITLTEDSSIVRTEEPDGAPYKFKALLLRGKLFSDTLSGNFTFYFCGTDRIGCAWWGHKTNVTKIYRRLDEIAQHNGYWRSEWTDWVTSSDGVASRFIDDDYTQKHDMVQYPFITKFQTQSVLPAGTYIEVWGVRANA